MFESQARYDQLINIEGIFKMKHDQPTTKRRRFLTLMGGGAVMLPFAGLVACSSDDSSAPTVAASAEDAASTRPDPATPSAEKTAENASAQARASAEKAATDGEQMATDGEQMASNDSGGNGDMPRLSEDNPQAKSLQYKHIASDVDHSRYKEGQQCSNCQLWQGSDSDEWAGCGIFAGKVVKATGWCTAYAPMSA